MRTRRFRSPFPRSSANESTTACARESARQSSPPRVRQRAEPASAGSDERGRHQSLKRSAADFRARRWSKFHAIRARKKSTRFRRARSAERSAPKSPAVVWSVRNNYFRHHENETKKTILRNVPFPERLAESPFSYADFAAVNLFKRFAKRLFRRAAVL